MKELIAWTICHEDMTDFGWGVCNEGIVMHACLRDFLLIYIIWHQIKHDQHHDVISDVITLVTS